MSNPYEKIDGLSLRDVIDRQFTLQVDVPWPTEPKCMEGHGLKNAKTVLDIGTGSGYFLCRLAERYPEKQFTGVEVDRALVEMARRNVKSRGLKNVKIVEDHCPTTKLKATYDFIFNRLALDCAQDKEGMLTWLNGLLRPGGRLAIIEADIASSHACPPYRAWRKYVGAVVETIKSSSTERKMGRRLPYMLLGSGFRDIRFEQKYWYSSIGMDAQKFLNYWMIDSLTVHRINPHLFTKNDLQEFRSFIEQIAESQTDTLIVPVIVISGQKPY